MKTKEEKDREAKSIIHMLGELKESELDTPRHIGLVNKLFALDGQMHPHQVNCNNLTLTDLNRMVE